MKSTRRAFEKLKKLHLVEGCLQLEYCDNPFGIEKYFSHETNLRGLPPEGITKVHEFDLYYLIKREDKVVGFVKILDLFFDGVIEVHGSYDGPNNFLIRRYFLLCTKIIHTIQRMYPDKVIKTFVKKDNIPILGLLKWLHFEPDPNGENTNIYNAYILKDMSMLSPFGKIVHHFFQ